MLYNNSNVILPDTFHLLQKLSQDPFFEDFFLVGGTALSLQIGHRFSIDLDFFSISSFDAGYLINYLAQNYEFHLSSVSKNTVLGFVQHVKVDFITHAYPLVLPLMNIEGIRLTSLLDIAAMKLNVIVNSGQRVKDFIDIYFLLEHHSMNEILTAYTEKYIFSNAVIALKAVSYFADLDPKIDPPMMKDRLPISIIKKRLIQAVEQPDFKF